MNEAKKFSAPTKFDQAAYLSRWLSYRDNEEPTVYIQVNEDVENPRWITIGEFYSVAFMAEDDSFIYECAKLFHTNEMKLLQKKDPVA